MQLKCIELWLLAFNLILARSFQILLVAKDFEILDIKRSGNAFSYSSALDIF